MEKVQNDFFTSRINEFYSYKENYESKIGELSEQLSEAEQQATISAKKMESIRKNFDDANDQYVESRIQLALLKDKNFSPC